MLLEQFFVSVYCPARRKLKKNRSVSEYRTTLKQFDLFLHRPAELQDLNNDTINRFLTYLAETPKSNGEERSASTLNKRRVVLLALWRYAMKREDVALKAINVEPFPVQKVKSCTWSESDLARMLLVALELKGNVPGTTIKARHFWTALIMFLYVVGTRITATLRIRPEHYNRKTKMVWIEPANQKTGEEQDLKVGADVHHYLKKLQIGKHEYLFPWPYDKNEGTWGTLYRHFRRLILGPAGLPMGRRDLFHKFRRSNATAVALEKGIDVAAKQLGHSDAKITKDSYFDETREEREHAADFIPIPDCVKRKKKGKRKSD